MLVWPFDNTRTVEHLYSEDSRLLRERPVTACIVLTSVVVQEMHRRTRGQSLRQLPAENGYRCNTICAVKSVPPEINQLGFQLRHVTLFICCLPGTLAVHCCNFPSSLRKWVRPGVAVGNPRALTAQTPWRWMKRMYNFIQA